MYYKSMKSTQKCDECSGRGEHKIWCSFAPAHVPTIANERQWFAITSDGRRLSFKMGAKVEAAHALDWARRHSHILQFEQLAFSTDIVSVETGEERTA